MSDKSNELFSCGYGAILPCDKEVLEACLAIVCADATKAQEGRRGNGVVRVLEIGMHDGNTARGIERYVEKAGLSLKYYGIDPDDGSTRARFVPRDAEVLIGDSVEVFGTLPWDFDLIWCDGCHCYNHVLLEAVHYSRRLRVGGFMCYHDVNPRGQRKGYQYHGPRDEPLMGIAVNEALEDLGFANDGTAFWVANTGARLEWFKEGLPEHPDRVDCGTRAYRRVQ